MYFDRPNSVSIGSSSKRANERCTAGLECPVSQLKTLMLLMHPRRSSRSFNFDFNTVRIPDDYTMTMEKVNRAAQGRYTGAKLRLKSGGTSPSSSSPTFPTHR